MSDNQSVSAEYAYYAIQSLAEAFLLVDPYSDKIMQFNAEALRLLGCSEESMLSMRFSSLFGANFPSLVAFTDSVLSGRTGWTSDLVCRNSTGKDLHVEISASCIKNDDTQLLAFLMRDTECTESRKRKAEANDYIRRGLGEWRRIEEIFQDIERENQLLLQAVGDGIYGVNASGETTFLNPAAEKILGWKAGEVVGKDIHTLIHHSYEDGEHYHVHDCPIYAAFHDGAVHRVDDEVFWRKDGKAIPVEYTSTPITDQGRLVGAVVIFRNISERKAARKKLHAALEEVQELKHRLELENAYLQEEIRSDYNYKEIVGKSSAIQRIISQIELVAPTDSNVLITGESGTGKELLARAIHDSSNRRGRPLIRVNCAAIPRDLFESEFFGHVKGAFTGATAERAGRFELADGGTLFLDEVGEIPVELQGKLLRVLQEGQFERIGESQTKNVNVRLIAATNRDLQQEVMEKRFREDLYFRLNVFPVESVPLRRRKEDIPLLAKHFVQHICKRLNKTEIKITRADIEKLMEYHWPGNIRELENVMERAIILSRGERLVFDMPTSNSHEIGHYSETSAQLKTDDEILNRDDMRRREIRNIERALRKSHGKIFGKKGAATILGMKPTTLASRIKRLGIDKSAYCQT